MPDAEQSPEDHRYNRRTVRLVLVMRGNGDADDGD